MSTVDPAVDEGVVNIDPPAAPVKAEEDAVMDDSNKEAEIAAPPPPDSAAKPPVAPPVAPSRTSSSKSKKKKAAPVVQMATAAASQASQIGAQGENTGRWTAEEHRLFLQGLELHGKGWKKIASLIKSRTVVQIRTHAQKYFQKLAKARQNGEEGEISMEGRGGTASVTAVSPSSPGQNNKRRRQATGTKRKVIQNVVSSAQRQGKKFAATGVDGTPLPTAAPALAHFVLPVAPSSNNNSCVPSITTAQGTISGPALEDSLFRFLTPAPPSEPQVNEVARQAGANPITLPSGNPSSASDEFNGDVSPTGVTELSAYPSWTDAKDTPSWYQKGADVDALLDVGDTLDWLADTGDLHESYYPPAVEAADMEAGNDDDDNNNTEGSAARSTSNMEQAASSNADMSVSALPTLDANNVDSVVPPLPSLFDGTTDEIAESMKKQHLEGHGSVANMDKTMSHNSIDDHLQVFDSPMEEHDFVSTILENASESHGDFAELS